MPYYVFSVRPFGQIEKRAEHAGFRDASAQAKTMRQALVPGGDERIQVMFAETEDDAIALLCQPREGGPSGDD